MIFLLSGFFKKHPPLILCFFDCTGLIVTFSCIWRKEKTTLCAGKNSELQILRYLIQKPLDRLYLQKKDNRNIALKMFTYFLEQVRNNYYLNTQNLNNEFAEALSRKSGVPETKVKHLLQLMDETDHADKINDIRLLELHNLIQEYFKK